MRNLVVLGLIAVIVWVIAEDIRIKKEQSGYTTSQPSRRGTIHVSAVNPFEGESLYEMGLNLYRSKCASCHLVTEKMTGPALYGSKERWIENGDFDGTLGEAWFYLWIKNNKLVLDAGHPYANKLSREYQKSLMNAFATFTNEQIDAIFHYVELTGSDDS